MTYQIPVEEMSLDYTVEHLRHVALMFAGYAFALAERAGMSAEDAADLWLTAVSAIDPAERDATAEEVERIAKRDAAYLAMMHRGAELVRTEDRAWSLTIDVSGDLEELERFGTSREFWVRWLAAQQRQFSLRDGYTSRLWLEGERLREELSI